MNTIDTLKLALEALIHKANMIPVMQGNCYVIHPEAMQAVIDEAIKQALAAPTVQEPFDHQQAASTALRKSINRSVVIAKNTVPTLQKRPPNCGTGYCSCVECVMEPAPVPELHKENPYYPATYIGEGWQDGFDGKEPASTLEPYTRGYAEGKADAHAIKKGQP